MENADSTYEEYSINSVGKYMEGFSQDIEELVVN